MRRTLNPGISLFFPLLDSYHPCISWKRQYLPQVMFSTSLVIVASLPMLTFANHLFYCTNPMFKPRLEDVLDANLELNEIARIWGNRKVLFSRYPIPITEGYRVPAYVTRFGISQEPDRNMHGAILIDLAGPLISSELILWNTVTYVVRDILIRCIVAPKHSANTTAGSSTVGDTNSLYLSIISLQGLPSGVNSSVAVNPLVRGSLGEAHVGV